MKGPSHMGDNLCLSIMVWILHSTRSPIVKLLSWTFLSWYLCMACWHFADYIMFESLDSSSLSRSSTRPSSDRASMKLRTLKDWSSILVGNMTYHPCTRKNDVCPVTKLGDVCSPHKMARNSSNHRQSILGLSPLRTSSLSRSTSPFLWWCATKSKFIMIPLSVQ